MVGTRQRAAAAAAQSCLLLAVVEDDCAAVQREAAQQRSLWWCPESGLTALHLAVVFASPAVLQALLAARLLRDSSLRARLVDARLQNDFTSLGVLHPLLESATTQQRLALRKGATALHMAVYIGNADVVRLLLAAKACPNVPDAFGQTAMHYATCAPMLHAAIDGPRGIHTAGLKREPHQATPHPDIPRQLLAAGGDIHTASSRGMGSPLVALCDAGADGNATSLAYLTHAAEQHAAGQWAPDPWFTSERQLVERAVQVGCRPFFEQFWPRVRPHALSEQLYCLAGMGALEEVAAMLHNGSVSAAAQCRSQDVLTHAVNSRRPAMVQLLLQHGAPVVPQALVAAVTGRPQPGVLRLLLAAGLPATRPPPNCPIEAVLYSSVWELAPVENRAAYYRDAMVCMELMAEAGMRTCIIWREEPPARGQDHAYYMRRYSMRRWLWMSYMPLAWEPATHRKFQPAFRAAARTLLLAAHRISHQPERSTAAGLGALPQDVLLNIIGIAAYPTSAWV